MMIEIFELAACVNDVCITHALGNPRTSNDMESSLFDRIVYQTSSGLLYCAGSYRVGSKSGLPPRFARYLHSTGFSQHQHMYIFCIGAVTMSALVGVEDCMIQALGRWQSSAFLLYIQTYV